MTLVKAILKGISDDRIIGNHIAIASPMRDLIEQYNKLAFNNDALPPVLSTSTGEQLKQAVAMLDPEIQVALLHKYSVATKTLDTPTLYAEDPIKADERKFRIYVAKLFVTMIAIMMFVLMGVVIALSVKDGKLANEGVIQTLMETAGEIIKLIIGSRG